MDKQERINAIYSGIMLVTGIDSHLIKGRSRKREIVESRQLCAYFIRHYTNDSLLQIGMETGNRDHSTVLNDIKKVNDYLFTDRKYKSRFEQVHSAIIAEFNHVDKYTNEYNEMVMDDYSVAMLTMAKPELIERLFVRYYAKG